MLLSAAALFWRPLGAWWFDDLANVALAKNDDERALAYLARGLALSPRASLLLEDRGRALLDRQPGAALRDFKAAACGPPCIAEEGDAQSRLGHADAAVSAYLRAKAAPRLSAAVAQLIREGRYSRAIALENALIARLDDGLLYSADLAAAYAALGRVYATLQFQDARGAAGYRRKAIAAYRHAAQLAPFNEGFLLSYGFAELDWGDAEVARGVFRRLLALHPYQADARRALRQLREQHSPGTPAP